MSILNQFIVYKSLKDTLKCRRGTRRTLFHVGRFTGARAGAIKSAGVWEYLCTYLAIVLLYE